MEIHEILGGLTLRSIDSWLDRFTYKHPKFAIPNLMTILVVGNIIVYLLNMFGPSGVSLSALLAFIPGAVFQGQIWRCITFLFVPMDSNPFLLLLSLYFYWWIGSTLEREWGSAKFTVFYLLGVGFNIVGGLLLGIAFPISLISVQYLNLSLFFAFATLYPNMQVLLFFIIPVKMKWLAWLDAALFAWSIFSSLFAGSWMSALVPVLALLNYLFFFWSDLMGMINGAKRRVQHQTSRQTVNFKQATKQTREQKGYLHKCAVCGKTDTDHPEMEFRYCSKCNGYYCYCSEHINNHVHID